MFCNVGNGLDHSAGGIMELSNLNHKDASVRLATAIELKDECPKEVFPQYINNHVHTCFSFSPYSPTAAVYYAKMAGLKTVGIMDHDSIAGAKEFIEAGKIFNIATTIGIECRVDMSKTRLADKKINNPDQAGIAYIALHGIPHTKIDEVDSFFKPLREKRNQRNIKMISKLNELTKEMGIVLDFENDVVPLSCASEGGSITERHILFALAKKLTQTQNLINSLNQLGIELSEKQIELLCDKTNSCLEYDLLAILKAELIEKFYINATDECLEVKEVLAFSKKIGAISAYAYLGDVGQSVTGDKKTQKFEDDYLDLLFEELSELGFNAVTYMPSRNTIDQLVTIKGFCKDYGFLEISGEDINSPRQDFICHALDKPMFSNLIMSTWALIGHELAATENIDEAMFSQETITSIPKIDDRIKKYFQLSSSFRKEPTNDKTN